MISCGQGLKISKPKLWINSRRNLKFSLSLKSASNMWVCKSSKIKMEYWYLKKNMQSQSRLFLYRAPLVIVCLNKPRKGCIGESLNSLVVRQI